MLHVICCGAENRLHCDIGVVASVFFAVDLVGHAPVCGRLYRYGNSYYSLVLERYWNPLVKKRKIFFIENNRFHGTQK